jgi:hypothetical protein
MGPVSVYIYSLVVLGRYLSKAGIAIATGNEPWKRIFSGPPLFEAVIFPSVTVPPSTILWPTEFGTDLVARKCVALDGSIAKWRFTREGATVGVTIGDKIIAK